MFLHTFPFMILIFALPGAFILALMEHLHVARPVGLTTRLKVLAGFVTFFVATSVLKIALAVILVAGTRISTLAQANDYLWTCAVLIVPFLVPHPSAIYNPVGVEPVSGVQMLGKIADENGQACDDSGRQLSAVPPGCTESPFSDFRDSPRGA